MSNNVDVGPLQRPCDLVSESDFLQWMREHADTPTELPWEADPHDMPLIAELDSSGLPCITGGLPAEDALIFGSDSDPERDKVTNWVQVDDLGGMGQLWCGSFGGKFYLTATTPANTDTDTPLAPAAEGEEAGMMALFDIDEHGIHPLSDGGLLLPRRACPMSERDALLKVGGKWRSDLHWDTLINGPLCYMPPIDDKALFTTATTGTIKGCGYTTPFRYFTLRLEQVGRWLCFHSLISEPQVNIIYTQQGYGSDTELAVERFEFITGEHHTIGYSPYDGTPWPWEELGSDVHHHHYHGWTAEPPWGTDLSNSWQGDSGAEVAPSDTPGDIDGYPSGDIDTTGLAAEATPHCHGYCRIFPRLSIGEGWYSPWLQAGISTDPTTGITLRTPAERTSIEATAENLISTWFIGGHPDWMEDFAGIDIPLHEELRSEDYIAPEKNINFYASLLPTAALTKTFSIHLPLPDGGNLYISLHTATIDGTLLTASACIPYNYWATSTS